MKKLLLIIFALLVAGAGFYYISGLLVPSRAEAPRALVSYSAGSLFIQAEQPAGNTNTNKISAFDLTITSSAGGNITAVGTPLTYPGGDASIFTQIIAPSGLPGTRVRFAYVIQRPTAELPVAIRIPITTNAPGGVTLATGSLQEVVGYIPSGTGNSYVVVASTGPSPTSVQGGSFTIEVGTRGVLEFAIKDSLAPTSTPVPGVTNTPRPGASNTPRPQPTTTPFPHVTSPPINTNTPQIRFALVLESAVNFPEIKVRVKVTDLVAAITPAANQPQDTCRQPGHAQMFYENVQMVADGSGVWRPKPGAPFTKGGTVYYISTDGWLPLVDTQAGRAYAIALKGPKHRSQRMVDTVLLQSGQHPNHDFDWTGLPLAPGDLPDPNSGNRQDCTVNTLDLSRIEGLLAATDTTSLAIADVNFDGVVNGNDISKVVGTLSTKPDDD